MVVNNLQQFAAAIAAVCPIDGVASDGTITFDASATPAQIAAANAAAATYTDVPSQPITLHVLMGRLTAAEYTAIVNIANTRLAASNPDVHRFFFGQHIADMSLPGPQALMTALVTAGVLTQARANIIFAAAQVLNQPPQLQPQQPH